MNPHWLAKVPHLPTWTGWPVLVRLANGGPTW